MLRRGLRDLGPGTRVIGTPPALGWVPALCKTKPLHRNPMTFPIAGSVANGSARTAIRTAAARDSQRVCTLCMGAPSGRPSAPPPSSSAINQPARTAGH